MYKVLCLAFFQESGKAPAETGGGLLSPPARSFAAAAAKSKESHVWGGFADPKHSSRKNSPDHFKEMEGGFLCHLSQKRGSASFLNSVLLPVVIDVLHVVVLFQQVDELLHVLDVALIGELHIVLGDHLHAGLQEGVALLL